MNEGKYPIAARVSMRASNALFNADITDFEQLTEKRAVDLLQIEDFGRRSLREVSDVMNELGLRFLDGWGYRPNIELQDQPSIGIDLVYHTKPDVKVSPVSEIDKENGVMRCKITMPMPVVKVTIQRPDGSVSVFEDGQSVESSE